MKFSKEAKAGIIALISIIAFVVLFQFMKGKNFFSDSDTYFVKYDNVEGLTKASPVTINGLKVGKVTTIIPVTSKDGHVSFVVKMNINAGFDFSKESKVEIYSAGIMSDKELRINMVYKGAMAQDGDTLQGDTKLSAIAQITNQVGPVADRLTTALESIDSLSGNANKVLDAENRKQFRLLLENLNKTTQAIAATAATTDQLIASNQKQVGDLVKNANTTMISANDAVKKFGNVASNLNTQQLNDAIAQLGDASKKLNTLIAGIESGQGSMGKLIKDPELYNNLNKSVVALSALLEDLQKNPKRYVNFSVFGKASK